MYRVAIKEVKRYVYEYGSSAHTKGGAMNKKKTSLKFPILRGPRGLRYEIGPAGRAEGRGEGGGEGPGERPAEGPGEGPGERPAEGPAESRAEERGYFFLNFWTLLLLPNHTCLFSYVSGLVVYGLAYFHKLHQNMFSL